MRNPWQIPASFLAISIFIAGGTLDAKAEDQTNQCSPIPPLMKMDEINFYKDSAGSLADPAKEQKNIELRAGLTAFLTRVEKAYDQEGANFQCAEVTIAQWATAGALLVSPTSATARVDRVFTAVALNSIALKAKRVGHPLSAPEIAWLRALTDAVRADYGPNSLRDTPYFRNNVFFWSSTALALYALLSRDPAYIEASNQAWHDVIGRIDQNGYLPAELHRGSRALIYHQLSYSALLILRETRIALGQHISQSDDASLKRLASIIGQALCDSSTMSKAAGVPDQEKPGEWGFRVSIAFGAHINSPDWSRCGLLPKSVVDIKFGGDLSATRDAISDVGKR